MPDSTATIWLITGSPPTKRGPIRSVGRDCRRRTGMSRAGNGPGATREFRSADIRRGRPADRQHLVHAYSYAFSHDVDIRGVVVVAGDPEVELAVVRQDGNADADLDPDRYVWVCAQHAASGRVK